MARKSKIAKAAKLQRKYFEALAQGRKPKFATKVFNVCSVT